MRAAPIGGTWSGQYVTATGLFTPPVGFFGSVTLTYTVGTGACAGSVSRRIGTPTNRLLPAWAEISCSGDREAPLRIRFSDAGSNATTTWDFGDNTRATGAVVEHTYTQPGTFRPVATLTYATGTQCQARVEVPPIIVRAAELPPNVITPDDGDQLNQFFVVKRGCTPQLRVFSRWGAQVYESAAYANDWSGTGLSAGLYYYLLRFPDGNTTKGWVEIIR
ncbi:gliding motility-associated C-terminal domain-containing protein [Hymenobacter koreensis]|uniref:T9SS type B sorting domain-containing protein n=1 Tax=Hymenobacter koreensis TaxID=1084523 RepID=UPI0031EBF69A